MEKCMLEFWHGTYSYVFTLNICPWDMLESYHHSFAKIIGAIQFPWRYLRVATLFMVFTTVLGLQM